MPDKESAESNLKQQKKILNAFFDSELQNPDTVKGEERKEISIVAQCSVEDLNMILKSYTRLCQLHKWLREVK